MTYIGIQVDQLKSWIMRLRIKLDAMQRQVAYLQSKCKHSTTKTSYSSFCGQFIEWTTCVDCGYETHKDVPEKEDSWDSDET